MTRLIQEIRPDTMVTFGPDGMTGHADHQTISRWVTAAWDDTGRRGRLWYATLTPEYHQRWAAVNSEIGLWFEGSTPPSDPATDLAFTVHCEGELLDRKFAALRAHTSQTTGLIEHLGVERYRHGGRRNPLWTHPAGAATAPRPDQQAHGAMVAGPSADGRRLSRPRHRR